MADNHNNDSNNENTTKTEMEIQIWELPEVLLYQIASFVAPATARAHILCHKIAPLCQASYHSILEDSQSKALWDLVLNGDYGINTVRENQRRCCKRLRRCPVDRVRDAHRLIKDNTEIAYYHLWELSYELSTNSVTRRKLCNILDEYGPHLLINRTVSSGGTFLVEVCRARHTTQNAILQCVQELIENRNALINLPTNESSNSTLTALCVAACRALPNVVKYLLSKGASPTIKCSARFRLYKNPKKSVRCTNATPLEFAQSMLNAEIVAGANDRELTSLKKCIRMLSN